MLDALYVCSVLSSFFKILRFLNLWWNWIFSGLIGIYFWIYSLFHMFNSFSFYRIFFSIDKLILCSLTLCYLIPSQNFCSMNFGVSKFLIWFKIAWNWCFLLFKLSLNSVKPFFIFLSYLFWFLWPFSCQSHQTSVIYFSKF